MRPIVWALCAFVSLTACGRQIERSTVEGTSTLVAAFNDAAQAFDVPSELLASVAWSETAFRPQKVIDHHDGHAPQSIGVMGLPEEGAVRSAKRAADLLGVELAALEDDRTNIFAAAALLRVLADETFGADVLKASDTRDRWLIVVEKYFDAGAAGEQLALEARKTAAKGLITTDARGKTVIIPSFAEVYKDTSPFATSKHGATPDYPGSTWVAANSGNYTADNRTGADIDVVVIHTTQGSYAGTISWFRNASSNVSAHYVIRRSDGAITQMVQHKDIAWHAGNWSYNQRSIGIEHEGYVADPNNYTPAMITASANLTRWLCDNLGIPKDRSHIIGHVEVPGATHTDPGQYFPWTQYMDLIRNGATPPPTGNGTLQGVIFIGTDNTRRIPGATLTITPGGQTATARAGDAYWSFNVAPGTYTVTARANGYDPSTVTRTVAAGSQTWGSMGLTPSAQPTTGTLKGVVYDARAADTNTRIEGATVEITGGRRTTSNETGYFEFVVPAGVYTISVSKAGWVSGSNQRTVTAGQIIWGSTGMVPENTTPPNRAPEVPSLVSPIGDATARSPAPIFTADGLRDPDGQAVTLEIAIYRDEALMDRISSGSVRASAQDRLVSWQHPNNDLPRGVKLFWRARAGDGTAWSQWSEPASFSTYDDGTAVEPSSEPFVAEVLPGVGTDQPPSAPEVRDPADDATVTVVRPQIVAKPALDPEGDELVYEYQIASDDLFDMIDAASDLMPVETAAPGWVVDRDLAPGARYYVRVRAADARLFSPWSPAVSFTVSADAVSNGEEKPERPEDQGGAPELKVLMEPEEGCNTTGKNSGILVPLGLLGVFLYFARRRLS